MTISKEKIEKIKSINTDNSDFILKINEYLNYKHEYLNTENVVESLEKLLLAQNSVGLIFSSKEINSKENKYIRIENISFKEEKTIDLYYAGKNYKEKVEFYKKHVKIFDKTFIKNYGKIPVIFDISSISSYPLWETMMRRRMKNIIIQLDKSEICEISKDFIDKVIIESVKEKINIENKYDIDFVIEFLREISTFNEIEPYFIDTEKTNETIYLVNELQKFIYALSLARDERYDYIYDTICKDMDEMFSRFGFCNFKENKCVAQRHKTFFNRYPVPETDGCCFKVVRKCEHNNKDGTCKVKCLPCKLFTCPYLGKLDVGIRASELILMRSFFNNKQKRISIHKFYNSKEFLLKKIKEQE